MTDPADHAAPPGLADLPLDVRRAHEVQRDRNTQEGLSRRHLAEAEFARCYREVHFDRVIRAGPAIAAALREG